MKKNGKKNSRENIEKFIGLFYMHCNNYTDFTTFSVDNVCSIYNVDLKIIQLLEKENVIRIKGVNGQTRYAWSTTPVNNELIEKIYNKLSNTKQVTNKNKVMKKKKANNKGKMFSEAEMEFLRSTMRRKTSAVAKKLGRSVRSIETKRLRLRCKEPGLVTEPKFVMPKVMPKPEKRRWIRRGWTKEEEVFIKTNLDKTDKWLGKMLDRTGQAVGKHRSIMGVSPPRGKGRKPKKLPKFLPVSKPRAKEDVIIPENLAEAKTKPRRIKILWGVVDIQY